MWEREQKLEEEEERVTTPVAEGNGNHLNGAEAIRAEQERARQAVSTIYIRMKNC